MDTENLTHLKGSIVEIKKFYPHISLDPGGADLNPVNLKRQRGRVARTVRGVEFPGLKKALGKPPRAFIFKVVIPPGFEPGLPA